MLKQVPDLPMPRFVVLRHQDAPCRELHWDLMLENGDVLVTWALENEPGPGPMSCRAERLADHRTLYLDYEGDVSGGRGMVTRLDAGVYTPEQTGDRRVVVKLDGGRLRGTATLEVSGDDNQRWRFLFVPDGTAASGLSATSTVGEPSDPRDTVSPAMKTSSSPS
jgi:DNA polymerase ligase (LigD)-like protein